VDKLDDEGRLEFPSEDQIYSVLGLKKEDETEEQERERRCDGCEDGSGAILIFQHLLGERLMFDRNNPVMKPGSLYPSMKEFRLAMRQYSIDKKFELGIEATDKRRYRKVVHDHHLTIFREKPDVCYWLDTYHSLLW
jgi:hypothetical protein